MYGGAPAVSLCSSSCIFSLILGLDYSDAYCVCASRSIPSASQPRREADALRAGLRCASARARVPSPLRGSARLTPIVRRLAPSLTFVWAHVFIVDG